MKSSNIEGNLESAIVAYKVYEWSYCEIYYFEERIKIDNFIT